MQAYLDNSATTQCSKRATDLMVKLLTEDFGNPSSMHMKGVEAEKYIKEAKEKIANRLPLHLKDAGLKVFDNWINNMTPVPNVREVIFKLKKEGKRLFLLSNISIGFSENYKKTPWINEVLSEFDGLILSGVTGLLKPDPEVFEYILSKYNLKREETLFIDDSPKNIKGAEAVRLRGYLFNGDGLKLERFLSGL